MRLRVSKRDNLDRYYLLKLFGFGIFIHHIHHDEEQDVYHNHPWDGLSIIFGSYIEERFGEPKRRRIGWNWIKATRFHRVELGRPVWTLFIHGRRYNRWQVKDKAGTILATEPWRDTGQGERTSYKPKDQ